MTIPSRHSRALSVSCGKRLDRDMATRLYNDQLGTGKDKSTPKGSRSVSKNLVVNPDFGRSVTATT